MKKLIVLAMIMAVILLVAALAHAQTPANDLKPTFISPTPGLYVNGWPAFTVSYPKEWVEVPLEAGAAAFCVGVPRPDLPPLFMLTIDVLTYPFPIEDWAKIYMPFYVQFTTDVKILSDKPSQLKDGIPAREVEIESVEKTSGRKMTNFWLMTKKDLAWVAIQLGSAEGRIGEDLKKYPYSLTFQPGREEPVKAPPDVLAFLDMYCVDLMGHDPKAIMAHFSDRFLHSGQGKAFTEQFMRNDPTSPIRKDIISLEAIVTVFESRGDKAYIDGFFLGKAKGDASALKSPMMFQQIINEHGQWKWFGNQK